MACCCLVPTSTLACVAALPPPSLLPSCTTSHPCAQSHSPFLFRSQASLPACVASSSSSSAFVAAPYRSCFVANGMRSWKLLCTDVSQPYKQAAAASSFVMSGGVVAKAMAASTAVEEERPGRFYFNITGFPFPLGPFLERRTIRKEVEKGLIWMLEQEQALAFGNVTTNIRMTVIKLKSGGLWIHAPIAPTDECIQLLNELEAPVEYIVLPTFAYEHKVFVGPFSRKFPRAHVWVAPRQWSWPVDLPLQFFGIFGAKILRNDDKSAPWVDEIDYKILSCSVGVGPYVEVAFFHKQSKILLLTDAVIFVPEKPPEVVGKQALLSAAKNGLAVKLLSAGKEVSNDPIIDDEATRQRGWERMVLQILFLGPSNLLEPKQSFAQMSKKLIVSPIVKTLVFDKVPEKVNAWVQEITREWKFSRIIPAHFAAPVAADGRDLRVAFRFLNDLLPEEERWASSVLLSISSLFSRASSVFPAADMKTLSSLDEFLVSVGAVKKTISGKGRQ